MISRFHSTFGVIYTMLFGTRAQALESSKQLYRRHTSIRGELPHATGEYPRENTTRRTEVAALRWVHATLLDSAMLAYEFVLPPLPAAEREQYYTESKRMAALFAIPATALPKDWAAFQRYTAEMLDSPLLCVDAEGRALGQSVMSGSVPDPALHSGTTRSRHIGSAAAPRRLWTALRQTAGTGRAAGRPQATPALSICTRHAALRRTFYESPGPAARPFSRRHLPGEVTAFGWANRDCFIPISPRLKTAQENYPCRCRIRKD